MTCVTYPFIAIYEDIKEVLFSDSAVAGEAAGIAMGLVMLGTANAAAIEEMLQYAHETQHEKIIRGLAIGISLIMYGQEEKADSLIEQLSHDKVGIVIRILNEFSTVECVGSYSPLWWYLHHCFGVLWNRQQQGHPTVVA